MMNPFIVLLLIGSLFCFMRAAFLWLSLKQKRAYPPVIVLKQQALLYSCFGAVSLVCMLLLRVFI